MANYQEIDLFSLDKSEFKINKPIRLIELFAGIGSQAKALKNLGVAFEHWFVCEFDKHAINSYNAIHGTDFETSDITKVSATELKIRERERYCYILTYSFPCQDLSLAGKQKGMEKGAGTRSGLLWEVERLLDELNGNLPHILLMENVPQVIGKKNIKDFNQWLKKLESLGYTNYIQILNAKDYGIPQNRKRCFMVSLLEGTYQFPKPTELKIRLKDMLEEEVDEKFYLTQKQLNYVLDMNDVALKSGRDINDRKVNKNIANTISCRGAEGQRADITNFVVDDSEEEIKVKDIKLAIKNATKQGYLLAGEGDGIDISTRLKNHRGTVQKGVSQTLKTQADVGVCVVGNYTPSNHEAGRVIDPKGLAPTIKENHGTVNAVKQKGLRIRKLTPKECWRLMGFEDEDFDKASNVNSNAQLYKQAGNSIVVNVLMAIFNQMIDKENYELSNRC